MIKNSAIDNALTSLEQFTSPTSSKPALVRIAPDSDCFLIGNQDGYVRLAIAALKAAKGEDQSFKGEDWVSEEELDWGFKGLKYDPDAETRLRKPPSAISEASRMSILLFVLAFAIIGAYVSVRTIASLIK